MKFIKNKKIQFLIVGFLLLLTYYKFSPYRIELIGYYDKIWAHRVNSLDKLNSATKYFKGVELDLVYDNERKVLDVNHPPAESIGLKFETYVGALGENQNPYLWLDVKNLNEENAKEIVSKINTVLEKHNYSKEKVLIETSFPKALKEIEDNNYKSSYYLPYGLCFMNNNELLNVISDINLVLGNNPKVAISSDIQDYQLLKKHFPKREKYLWSLGSIVRNNLSVTREALNDSLVKKVLVTHRSIKGNR